MSYHIVAVLGHLWTIWWLLEHMQVLWWHDTGCCTAWYIRECWMTAVFQLQVSFLLVKFPSLVKTLLLVASRVLGTKECSWTTPVRKDHKKGDLQGYCCLGNETSSLERSPVWLHYTVLNEIFHPLSTPCIQGALPRSLYSNATPAEESWIEDWITFLEWVEIEARRSNYSRGIVWEFNGATQALLATKLITVSFSSTWTINESRHCYNTLSSILYTCTSHLTEFCIRPGKTIPLSQLEGEEWWDTWSWWVKRAGIPLLCTGRYTALHLSKQVRCPVSKLSI